jgi:hypothetical protein
MTTWDTPADADEWSAALPALLPDVHAARRDVHVLAVLAPPSTATPSLTAAVLEQTRFAPGVACRRTSGDQVPSPVSLPPWP